MAVVFPFEVPLYEKEGLPVQFVGHPLLDREIPEIDTREAVASLGMKDDRPIIGLLPGSRKSEIDRLLPSMLGAAARIAKGFPAAQFISPVAPGSNREEIQARVARQQVPVNCVENRLHQALHICNLVLVA